MIKIQYLVYNIKLFLQAIEQALFFQYLINIQYLVSNIKFVLQAIE